MAWTPHRQEGDTVLDTMGRAEGWFMCRVGFVEIVRAVSLSADQSSRDNCTRVVVRASGVSGNVCRVDESF
jgi:hypothetical protein